MYWNGLNLMFFRGRFLGLTETYDVLKYWLTFLHSEVLLGLTETYDVLKSVNINMISFKIFGLTETYDVLKFLFFNEDINIRFV